MPALQFYDLICKLTKPLNDQYPRPWMTKLSDPLSASLFILGKNQAKGFPVSSVGTHERHLDALFNRNGETCRGLYDEIERIDMVLEETFVDWATKSGHEWLLRSRTTVRPDKIAIKRFVKNTGEMPPCVELTKNEESFSAKPDPNACRNENPDT